MHGILGQLAGDPVRLAIATVTVIAVVAITRCLSGLAFFQKRLPEKEPGPKQARPSGWPDDKRAARRTTPHTQSKTPGTEQ